MLAMMTTKFLGGFYAVALFVLVVTDACFVQTNTLATSAQDVFHIPLIPDGLDAGELEEAGAGGQVETDPYHQDHQRCAPLGGLPGKG